MSSIGVVDNLSSVKNIFNENGIDFKTISQERISEASLDDFDVIIVNEHNDVSINSKDVTVIEAKRISADEVYEKVKYMQ